MDNRPLDKIVSLELTRRQVLGLFGVGVGLLASDTFSPFNQIAEAMTEIAAEKKKIKRTVKHGYPLNTRYELNPTHTRRRSLTDYVILHTTEAEFPSSLNKITRHANAHYLVDRDGSVYSIVPLDRWANHAGRSMWEGKENLSDRSIGIEVVGYHYSKLTEKQYKSLKSLVEDLQQRYGIQDRNVLAHFQIAYAVNRWTRGRKARGRRKDGINIDWGKLGIHHRTDDQDTATGRVMPDQFLAAVLAREERGKGGIFGIGAEDPVERVKNVYGSNTISGDRTAWTLSGDEYDQPTTFYVAPNNTIIRGDQVKDWGKIAAGTRVYINTNLATVVRTIKPVITLSQGETVWSNVQAAYNDDTTCYIPPNSNEVIKGNKADFNKIGPGTRIVLECKGTYEIKNDRSPIRIAGGSYNTEDSIYIFPTGVLKTGREIQNFSTLPKGTKMLVRK